MPRRDWERGEGWVKGESDWARGDSDWAKGESDWTKGESEEDIRRARRSPRINIVASFNENYTNRRKDDSKVRSKAVSIAQSKTQSRRVYVIQSQSRHTDH